MLHRHSCLPACQRVTGHRLFLRLLTRGIATRENQLAILRMPSVFAAVHEFEAGTNSPFAAPHKSGSYRGFICRA